MKAAVAMHRPATIRRWLLIAMLAGFRFGCRDLDFRPGHTRGD